MGPGPHSWAPILRPGPHNVPWFQEEEERDESGCEEEEGREDEDEDSGSEESLVDSDSDPEEKGACLAGAQTLLEFSVMMGPRTLRLKIVTKQLCQAVPVTHLNRPSLGPHDRTN